MFKSVDDAKPAEMKEEALNKLKLLTNSEDFTQLVKKLENERTFTKNLNAKILAAENQIKKQLEQERESAVETLLNKVQIVPTFEQQKEFLPQLKKLMPDLDYKRLVASLESDEKKRIEDDQL